MDDYETRTKMTTADIRLFFSKYGNSSHTRAESKKILTDFIESYAPQNGITLVGNIPVIKDSESSWMDHHVWNDVQSYICKCIQIHNNIPTREKELARSFDKEILIKLKLHYKTFDLNDMDILHIWSDVKEQYIRVLKYTDGIIPSAYGFIQRSLSIKLKEMEQYKNVKQEDILGLNTFEPDMLKFPSRESELSGLF